MMIHILLLQGLQGICNSFDVILIRGGLACQLQRIVKRKMVRYAHVPILPLWSGGG